MPTLRQLAPWMLAGWVVAVSSRATAVPAPDRLAAQGRAVFARLCADCHGTHGEGVPGRYRQPLGGDLTLPELTRLIETTMPEDNPDACVGEEAAAVASFVFESFYAPEAHDSTSSARVELVHLTQRQYLNAVADLIGHFQRDPRQPDEERGLLRQILPARRSGAIRIESVDPVIHADFGLDSPDPELIDASQFTIRWTGSVLAPDTGDYEFFLSTETGASLWINDNDNPLIDARVASGGLREHSAALRLIGGRAYPLRLEISKSRDSADRHVSARLEWRPPHGVRQIIPSRHLAPVATSPTFVVSTPFPPDDASVGYERGTLVSRAWLDATTHAAVETASHVARNLDRLAGIRRSEDPDDRSRKIRDFCLEFVATAFRRPLSAEEHAAWIDAFLSETAPEAADAVKKVVLLALTSPRFLYLGIESTPPDARDIAARLSFALRDSIPDRQTLEAADRGTLSSPEGVRSEARRMLDDPRARAKIREFIHGWLDMNHAADLAKDPAVFPEFTDALASDLRTSLDLFLDDVLWGHSPDYRRLLRSDTLHANRRIAEFYGLPPVDSDLEFIPVSAPDALRSGVLTHPFLLSAFAYSRSTSPIHRGVFLSRRILGRTLKSPPEAVAFNEADFDPSLTTREKVARLTAAASCQTCHSIINPLGFTLEHFDAVGRPRTTDAGRPIDAAGTYFTRDGLELRLAGPRDVAEFAVGSPRAHEAFVEQLFHHVVKQPVRAYGPDVLSRLRDAFEASGFHIRGLIVEIAAVASLHGVPTRQYSQHPPEP